MREQVVTEYIPVLSTRVVNIDAEKNEEEEDTGVASSANLKCSIVEVVGRDYNRVVVVVTNSDMVVGLLVAKEAS